MDPSTSPGTAPQLDGNDTTAVKIIADVIRSHSINANWTVNDYAQRFAHCVIDALLTNGYLILEPVQPHEPVLDWTNTDHLDQDQFDEQHCAGNDRCDDAYCSDQCEGFCDGYDD
jgi:hypothetical protein